MRECVTEDETREVGENGRHVVEGHGSEGWSGGAVVRRRGDVYVEAGC